MLASAAPLIRPVVTLSQALGAEGAEISKLGTMQPPPFICTKRRSSLFEVNGLFRADRFGVLFRRCHMQGQNKVISAMCLSSLMSLMRSWYLTWVSYPKSRDGLVSPLQIFSFLDIRSRW